MKLPHEIQLRILSFIERPSYILPGGVPSKNSTHAQTLSKMCRIKSWNRTATEELYKNVRIETHNLIQFIYGILASSGSDQLEYFLLELGPQFLQEEPDIVEEEQMQFDDLKSGTREFEKRLNMAIAEADKLNMKSPTSQSVPGNGHFVKQLLLPSWDPNMHLIKYLLPLIPNCNNMKFNHPLHGQDFLPTLSPLIIRQCKSYFSQLQYFGVNDVDKKCWPLLLDALKYEGYNIKVLSIEACSELEPYTSKTGLSTIFPSLRNLECLRLDGVPVNSYDFTWGGDFDILILTTLCPNLTAVALDYCDLTMESFYTLWNNCENLEFLGLVGLTNESESIPSLKVKEKLSTLSNTQSDNGIIGVLDAEFLSPIIPQMKAVKVLNLYEQTRITEEIFLYLIKTNPQLRSLCLSGCQIKKSFLQAFLDIPNSIKQLSIACDLTIEDYQWFVNELAARNSSMEKIYTNLPDIPGLPTRVLTSSPYGIMHQASNNSVK
ncbi:hypothetical protein HDV06_003105 [Boothiomyces sp. JEL0866]|nr:hypothetical protein HDV06_003105 [Boothiomyces sp. JEL0866]